MTTTKMESLRKDAYATSSVSSSQTHLLCTFIPYPLFSPTDVCTMYLYRSSFFRLISASFACKLIYLARVSFQFCLS